MTSPEDLREAVERLTLFAAALPDLQMTGLPALHPDNYSPFANDLRLLIAAAQPLEAGSGWRPIESAPRVYGAGLLGWNAAWGSADIIEWVDESSGEKQGYWLSPVIRPNVGIKKTDQPTHWRPLPPPPSDHPVSEVSEDVIKQLGTAAWQMEFVASDPDVPGALREQCRIKAINARAALAAIQSPPLGGSVQEDYGRPSRECGDVNTLPPTSEPSRSEGGK